MSARLNLEGSRVGRLTVISKRVPEGKRRYYFLCKCDCGNTVEVNGSNLVSGKNRSPTKSCGCFSIESLVKRSVTHGLSRTREYKIWSAMKDRCHNPNSSGYPFYGAVGISVCERWRNGEGGKTGFECFFEDMGKRPTDCHSVDRWPDMNGNYEAGNCQWSTKQEQAEHRKSTKWLTINGKTMCATEAAALLGINYGTLMGRISNGWSIEKILGNINRNPRWVVHARDDEALTLKEWSTRFKIPYHALYRRVVQQGLPIDESIDFLSLKYGK